MMKALKVCCLQSYQEASDALAAGADFLGFVAEGTGDWGPIAIDQVREIIAALPPGAPTVVLTSQRDPEAIADCTRHCRPHAIQLTNGLDGSLAALVERLRPTKVFFTVHMVDETAVHRAVEASEFVDAIMLDTGSPSADRPVLGATGRVHDWSLSARVVAASRSPVFLAGGIRSSNLKAALDTVQPHGIDVASGVRAERVLQPQTVREFVQILRAD